MDQIGGASELANGNYVISSPWWSGGGAAERGAVIAWLRRQR
jgi:hypothetical protein